MYYSLIGVLALLIMFITNHDVLLKRHPSSETPVQKKYRRFLLAVVAYYVTDVVWGVLDGLHLMFWLYVDTELYFIAMALGVLCWTRYVIEYLGDKSFFRKYLLYTGNIIFVGVFVMIVVNLFYPVFFWFDSSGAYHTGIARHIALLSQIILMLMTSVYALRVSARTKDDERSRYLTIGLSGLLMFVLVSVQIFEPMLPLYAIGYMLSCCLLHTFVIENERNEHRRNLESALEREQRQLEELNAAWRMAYTDALTGVKSMLAYSDKTKQLDKAISDGTAERLAVAVFDLNDLKTVNDTLGHDTGDEYIKEACRQICERFDRDSVYRVGGDEFVVILQGEDYDNREKLLTEFNDIAEENRADAKVVVSVGCAEYISGEDNSYKRIFERADHRMYKRKKELKNQPAS